MKLQEQIHSMASRLEAICVNTKSIRSRVLSAWTKPVLKVAVDLHSLAKELEGYQIVLVDEHGFHLTICDCCGERILESELDERYEDAQICMTCAADLAADEEAAQQAHINGGRS